MNGHLNVKKGRFNAIVNPCGCFGSHRLGGEEVGRRRLYFRFGCNHQFKIHVLHCATGTFQYKQP